MNQPPGGGYPPGYGPPPGYAPAPGYAPPPGYAPAGYAPGYPLPPGYAPAGPMVAPYAPYAQMIQRVRHPKANTALILGGVSWFLGLWLIGSIPAWVIGASALREIRANPQVYSGESEAKVGMWLGIVHTILPLVIGIPIAIFFLVMASR